MKQIIPDNKDEEEIIKLLANEPKHIDQLLRESKFSSNKLNGLLVTMELKGKISCLGNGSYRLQMILSKEKSRLFQNLETIGYIVTLNRFPSTFLRPAFVRFARNWPFHDARTVPNEILSIVDIRLRQ